MTARPRFSGVFPVAPTTFDERGEIDLVSQKRCVDFLIDAGANGICILANYSEQFALADDERKALMKEGGVIASDAVRHPLAPLPPATRAGLVEIARRLDPLVLRWAR